MNEKINCTCSLLCVVFRQVDLVVKIVPLTETNRIQETMTFKFSNDFISTTFYVNSLNESTDKSMQHWRVYQLVSKLVES